MTPQRNACTDTLSAAYQVRHRPSLRVLLTERLNVNAASHTLVTEFTQINNFPHHRSSVPECLLHVGYSQLLCLMASIVSNSFPFLPYPWQVQLNGHYHPLLRAHLFQCNKQQGVYWPQLVRDTDGCPTRVLLSPSATNLHSKIAINYGTKILLLTPINE